MFIQLLIWTLQFCLLIPEAYSFETPKHDSLFYYKSRDSVFLTNLFNYRTSYDIYVAGKTITVDIPTSVANVFDILNWKVINLKRNQLMFVHKNKPYILINQKIIGEMKYSGELSGSIIAFGDNEALHVPTIFNPYLIEPVPKWNYIELLYFDEQSERVSVRQSLPWLKEDDWKFIKEWKMKDYIHFDNKLYLLIYRSISKANFQADTQEISVIRLCLDKGSELISSAIEIHFTREAFKSNKIINLLFVFFFGTANNQTQNHYRYQVHTITLEPSSNTKVYRVYYIGNIVSLFEETANECASGSDNITLMRHHLRSEVGECKKTSTESCSTKENIVPSRDVSLFVTEDSSKSSLPIAPNSIQVVIQNMQFITLPYPYHTALILIQLKPFESSAFCPYKDTYAAPSNCDDIKSKSFSLSELSEADFHTNKLPHGSLFVTKEPNKILFIHIEVCYRLKTCTQCIMYGLYFGCIWSDSNCKHDDQPKNKATLIVNNCFKIINISPLSFNFSSSTIITIELDKPLNFMASQEYLVIQAGDNHCTNITMNEVFINCSMNLTKSGEFNIDVSLRSDRYADTSIISAVSTDKVHILAPEAPDNIEMDVSFTVILILFLWLIINSFAFIVYYRKCNKEHLNRFKKVSRPRKVKQFVGTSSDKKFIKFFDPKKQIDLSAITRVKAQIVSSTMSTLDDSTITNEPSRKRGSLCRSMRSAPRRMYQRKLFSPKRK